MRTHRYRLPGPVLPPEWHALVQRELRRQKEKMRRLTPFQLRTLKVLLTSISKNELPPYLKRKKLPHALGHGIFLCPKAAPLRKGQIIGLYTGIPLFVPKNDPEESLYAFEPLSDILLSKDEQQKWDSTRQYHPRRLYSLYIDAVKTGNFTRFINHSEKPNLRAELVQIPPNSYGIPTSPLEVLYIVDTPILPGEQLLISYDGDEHSYWKNLDIKPWPLFPRTFLCGPDGRLKPSRKKGNKLSH